MKLEKAGILGKTISSVTSWDEYVAIQFDDSSHVILKAQIAGHYEFKGYEIEVCNKKDLTHYDLVMLGLEERDWEYEG